MRAHEAQRLRELPRCLALGVADVGLRVRLEQGTDHAWVVLLHCAVQRVGEAEEPAVPRHAHAGEAVLLQERLHLLHALGVLQGPRGRQPEVLLLPLRLAPLVRRPPAGGLAAPADLAEAAARPGARGAQVPRLRGAQVPLLGIPALLGIHGLLILLFIVLLLLFLLLACAVLALLEVQVLLLGDRRALCRLRPRGLAAQERGVGAGQRLGGPAPWPDSQGRLAHHAAGEGGGGGDG
mmetsp:Transcript_40802/g.88996  ORF Transcript_40802/g.88996 Transcript_40802/m.88996 type:complete len:237 (+) Transcript_40802:393-1103(+)